jgi:hypothetical protein
VNITSVSYRSKADVHRFVSLTSLLRGKGKDKRILVSPTK